jgi:hypothetical protein
MLLSLITRLPLLVSTVIHFIAVGSKNPEKKAHYFKLASWISAGAVVLTICLSVFIFVMTFYVGNGGN